MFINVGGCRLPVIFYTWIFIINLTIHSMNARISPTATNVTSSDSDMKVLETTAVAGHTAALPCDIKARKDGDSVIVVLWYKGTMESPIYWIDTRKGNATDPKHFVEDDYADRFYFATKKSPATLNINDVAAEDAGYFRCRVDFQISRTINIKVKLNIIVPPGNPQISDGVENSLSGHIGPYNEGHSLKLICTSTGGKPTPALTWWKGTQLLKTNEESAGSKDASEVIVKSSITISTLNRVDLHSTLSCQASNNNITVPPSTLVSIDMNLNALKTVITSEDRALVAGKKMKITCKSYGSRPPAIITWWKDNKKLTDTSTTVSNDQNITTSVLTFIPKSTDDKDVLGCRADNPKMEERNIPKEDERKLNVLYSPELEVKFGHDLFSKVISEYHDVFLACKVRANPMVEKVSWYFEGEKIESMEWERTFIRKKELVLQNITRNKKGRYACSATNSQGTGTSKDFLLRISYSPVCKHNKVMVHRVSLYETISIACDVDAEPSDDMSFEWTFNNSMEKNINIANAKRIGSKSVIEYRPMTKGNYGILACSGTNKIGKQVEPCLYRIVYASGPDALNNCTIVNQTIDAIQVTCIYGNDGGLRQMFMMEIHDKNFDAFRENVTNEVEAMFVAKNLPPNREYLLKLYAFNDKGKGPMIILEATTSQLAQIQTVLIPKKSKPKPYKFSIILGILVGIVLVLVVIAIIIVIVMKLLNRRNYGNSVDKSEKTPDPIHLQILTEADDKNPDVITCSTYKSGCEEILKPSTLGNSAFHKELGAAVAAVYQYGATNPIEVSGNLISNQSSHQQSPRIPIKMKANDEITYAELSLPRNIGGSIRRPTTTEYATIDFKKKKSGSPLVRSTASLASDGDPVSTVMTPLVRLQTESRV